MIEAARRDGVDVTVETCPHYLLFDVESVAGTGTYSLICPPIRAKERVEKLWKQIAEGKIDYMGTDHCPYTGVEKHPQNLWDAPGGSPSLDVAIPAILEEGIKRRGLTFPQMSAFLAGNAAKRFGIYPRKGVIRVGADADLMLVDMDCEWIYHRENSFAKEKDSGFPYENRKLTCRIDTTIVRGTIVYQNGRIHVSPGFGKIVR